MEFLLLVGLGDGDIPEGQPLLVSLRRGIIIRINDRFLGFGYAYGVASGMHWRKGCQTINVMFYR